MAFAKLNSMKFLGLDGLKHFWTNAKTWIINRITTEVTAKIAEIVANAPENLDTLKEIADWISTHEDSASAMNTAILANTEAISGKADKIHTHTKSQITDFPTSLPANGGKSAKSSFLDEYVGAGGTRPTSGNIVPKDASEYGGMRKDVVTSLMTDSGHPGQDGHLLTMFWDSDGRWDTQLFLTCEEPPALKVRVKQKTADYGPWVDLITSQNIGSQTVAKATRLNTFASWNRPYVYDPTNGVRVNVYKITMTDFFNSILVQIYDDINFARCRRYVLGLWHVQGYGYNVSVTDLGGTKANGLKVWMGTDGNVYLQADVYWTSRISFSYLDDISDVTITKIGVAQYGSNKDIDGTVLFTPFGDPIADCGAIRADDSLSAASKEPEFLKAYWLYASNKMVIPIGAPLDLEDGCIWIE